jgi:KDO2-lipid IV(A) lauroyltransferase
MAKLKDEFAYRLALTARAVASGMSPRAAYNIGGRIGSLAYRLIGSRREIAKDNLRKAFGDSLSETEIDEITRNVFRNVGRTLFEMARFEKLGIEGISKLMIPDGLEFFQRAQKRGRGAILVTAHFGNWEMLGGWMSTQGHDFRAIAAVQHNRKVNQMLNRMRSAIGVEVIPARSLALREVFKALKGNRFVAIVSDQHDPSRELILDFFGRKAAVPKGPALFAIKADCPIAVYMMRRESYDRHVVIFGGEFDPPNTGDLDADIRTMTTAYLKAVEDIIRQYPDQWLWTHRRWKI